MPKATKPKAPVINFFAISAVTKAKGATVAIPGIRDLKACRRLRGVIEALETELETQVKAGMATHFIETGCATASRPENFTGADQGQGASCQLKARNYGPTGPNDETLAAIEAAGLGDMIDNQDGWALNQEVVTPEVLALINKALMPYSAQLPAGLFKPAPKRTVKREAIDRLFARHAGDAAFVELHLPLISTLAVRCNYDKADDNIAADAERVARLLAKPEMASVVAAAAADPEAVPPKRERFKKAA